MDTVIHALGLVMIPLIWGAVITGIIGLIRSLRAAPSVERPKPYPGHQALDGAKRICMA